MKVQGPSGLIVDVSEQVGRSMVNAGHVNEVPDTEGTQDKPKRTRTRVVKDSTTFDVK